MYQHQLSANNFLEILAFNCESIGDISKSTRA